ncbi:hypothetical protein PFISCL1PPCAC_20920, partial [Pristionchus fissidentatus]
SVISEIRSPSTSTRFAMTEVFEGDSGDGRPPPTQVVVVPVDENEHTEMPCKKVHAARIVLICAVIGMVITMCVFIATFLKHIHVLALAVLLLFFVCGIYAHWKVVERVKKIHSKYFCPLIAVFVCIIALELAMGVFGIYQYSIFAGNGHSEHAMFATLLFFAIFLIQGIMLCTVLCYPPQLAANDSRAAEELKIDQTEWAQEDSGEYGGASGGATDMMAGDEGPKETEKKELTEEEKQEAAAVAAARTSLSAYLCHVRRTTDDEEVREKMSAEDRETIVHQYNQTIYWLRENKTASKEEIEQKKGELRNVCKPILNKMKMEKGEARGGTMA